MEEKLKEIGKALGTSTVPVTRSQGTDGVGSSLQSDHEVVAVADECNK